MAPAGRPVARRSSTRRNRPLIPSEEPRVSVIVRTRNRPGLLSEAVESLRRQTMDDFEALVVNDGGAPPDPQSLGTFPGRGLRVLCTEPPHGRARALNTGLRQARGRYVAYLDDDDLFRPEHLETLVRFLDGSDEYRAAYTDVEQVGQTLGEDGRYRDSGVRWVFGRSFDAPRLLYKNEVPLIALMHQRSAAEEIGGFDEAFDLLEDWDFLIRLADVTRLHRLPKVTAVYRVRDDGSNATVSSPWLGEGAQAARRRLFTKHWGRRSPETDMSLVDGLDRERFESAEEIRNLKESLEAAKSSREEAASRLARAEADLRALRADAARQIQAVGEREAQLRAELARVGNQLDQINRSLVWRLLSPYWKLKELIRR